VLHRNVKLLGWASCLNDIASEMIFPLLPHFLLTVLGGNRFYLGVIEGVADTCGSLLKLWSGAWSDRAGQRRGFVLFGYATAAFVRPLIGIVQAPWQLFLIRGADRIGKGIRTSPRDALIADSTEPALRGRAFGFHRSLDHLGAAIGPVLAASFLWLWPNQLRLMFLLTLIPGMLVVLMLFFGLQESHLPTAEPPDANAAKPRLRFSLRPFNRDFRIFLLALIVFTLGNSSDAFLLVRAGELGVATAMLPILWVAFHGVKSVGNFYLGRWVDKVGTRLPLLLGWLLYALVYVAFAMATSAWQVWVFFLTYGVYYALTEPAEKTLVANLVGNERKGLAFGWFNLAVGVGALPSSLLFGWLYEDFGPLVAFGWGASLALVASLLLLAVRPPEK
jgi:MFS family permease